MPDARYNELARYVGASRLSKDRLLSTGGRFDMAAEIAREMKRVGAPRPRRCSLPTERIRQVLRRARALADRCEQRISDPARDGGPVPSATNSVMSEFRPSTVIIGGGPATVSDTVRASSVPPAGRRIATHRHHDRGQRHRRRHARCDVRGCRSEASRCAHRRLHGGMKGGPLVITDGASLTPVTGSWLSPTRPRSASATSSVARRA